MVKRSKKSKSKRLTLKKKHKVLRKLNEHHKKKEKNAKKLGLNRKKRIQKDPGVPNDWPFKEHELKALEARRASALEEIEQKKLPAKKGDLFQVDPPEYILAICGNDALRELSSPGKSGSFFNLTQDDGL